MRAYRKSRIGADRLSDRHSTSDQFGAHRSRFITLTQAVGVATDNEDFHIDQDVLRFCAGFDPSVYQGLLDQ
jgi:deoxycytidine triphosphate deaminase